MLSISARPYWQRTAETLNIAGVGGGRRPYSRKGWNEGAGHELLISFAVQGQCLNK
jgi:hypothetical protein